MKLAFWCPGGHNSLIRLNRDLTTATIEFHAVLFDPKSMRIKKFLPQADSPTFTSDAGLLRLSLQKFRKLRPEMYGMLSAWHWLVAFCQIGMPLRNLRQHLSEGDSCAAVVIATEPLLLIAAYTDELDCVAMLQFPDFLVQEYDLSKGTRLLSINLYGNDEPGDSDLAPGPNETGDWTSFSPLIADFMAEDVRQVLAYKQEIQENEWKRCYRMGLQYIRRYPGVARDGRPLRSLFPAC